MRKNKKLMLGAIAAMGVMAMGVGGVGTFAWYTASNASATVKDHDAINGTISAADPNYQIAAVELPVDITVTREDAQVFDADAQTPKAGLELGTWLAAQPNGSQMVKPTVFAAGFYHGYLDANEKAYYTTDRLDSANLSEYAVYTVTIKAQAATYVDEHGQSWTNEQIAEAIAGKEVNIALAGQDGSRARFYGMSTSTPVSGIPTAAGVASSATNAVTLGAKEVLQTSGQGTKFYFAIYVDGEHSGPDTTVNGNFTVTVTGE